MPPITSHVAFERIPVPALLLEASGEVIAVNPAAERMFDKLAAKVVGHPVGDLLLDDDLARLLDSSRLRSEQVHELQFETGQGRRTAEFVISAIEVEGRAVFQLFAIDITARKEAEAAARTRADAEEKSSAKERLESLGLIAGGVAHDFNNLLTVINGYSGRVLSRLDPAGSLHEDLAQVVQAGQEAAGLTRQLLAFSRKQVLQPTALDLNDVVSQSHQMLRRLIGGDIELVVARHPLPAFVMADPVQLQQVLLNLSVNARDAMPAGGTLTIRVARATLDEHFAAAHPGAESGASVLLEVSDTGIGMSPELQRRIFEPFFTTKDRAGGTGLGLATVYGIVQQSGGSIEVSSEPDRGTSFRIFLPRCPAPAAEEPVRPPIGQHPRPEAPLGTILVVEDQPEVRQFTAGALRSHGYTVLEAANGRDALALAETCLASIDLLLTDVIMPGMGGTELASALQREREPGRPLAVLYISGYTEGAISRDGVLLVNAMLLDKPFTSQDLLEKVRESLAPPSQLFPCGTGVEL